MMVLATSPLNERQCGQDLCLQQCRPACDRDCRHLSQGRLPTTGSKAGIRVVSNATPSDDACDLRHRRHVIAEAAGLSGVTTREYVWLPNAQAGDPGPMSPPMQAGLSSGKLGAAEGGGDDPTSPAQLISLNQPQQANVISVTPLAVFWGVDTGSPVTYFVHADHLDRPIMMTDVSKNQVWNAIYKPSGETYSITGTATLDARLPGQWFQLETGLAYNWHRHYDATTPLPPQTGSQGGDLDAEGVRPT